MLRTQVGHDFAGYKDQDLCAPGAGGASRFAQARRRMEAYVDLLRQRAAAKPFALFRDLLINVTNFFRDAEAFEASWPRDRRAPKI